MSADRIQATLQKIKERLSIPSFKSYGAQQTANHESRRLEKSAILDLISKLATEKKGIKYTLKVVRKRKRFSHVCPTQVPVMAGESECSHGLRGAASVGWSSHKHSSSCLICNLNKSRKFPLHSAIPVFISL